MSYVLTCFPDGSPYEPKVKLEESQNATNNAIDNSLLKLNETLDNVNCDHCVCDKNERCAKMQLIQMQKQQNEELHQFKLQMLKDRVKREKELHKLYIHEMTLKVENERRRAEILEKELGN